MKCLLGWNLILLFVCLKTANMLISINGCFLFLSNRCQIQIKFITKGNLLIQVGQGYWSSLESQWLSSSTSFHEDGMWYLACSLSEPAPPLLYFLPQFIFLKKSWTLFYTLTLISPHLSVMTAPIGPLNEQKAQPFPSVCATIPRTSVLIFFT